VSANGTVPDANGNGDPTDDSAPTSVTLLETPEIGAAKTVVAGPTNNGDGTYTLTYRLLLENSGDVVLTNVQLTDDLGSVFAGAAGFTVDNVTLVSGLVILNPGFTGSTPNINLLAGSDNLSAGQSAIVDVTVTVTAGPNLGPYDNSATASGASPAATMVSDQSTDGTVPDADGDGDPTNDSVVTSVAFSENAVLGAAKNLVVDPPQDLGDGTHRVTYDLTITNMGDVDLQNVQFVDDLGVTFGAALGFQVESALVTVGSLTINASYTGTTPDTDLLTGTDTLAPGQSATVEIILIVNPGFDPGPYNNSAVASGTSPSGIVLTDLSANGTNPDDGDGDPTNNGDGDPTNNNEPTPVRFNIVPEQVLVEKHAARSEITVGELVTYEITAKNNGSIPLFGISIQDTIPAGFKYVPDSARLIRAGADGLLGTGDDRRNGIVPKGERPLEFENLSFGGDEAIRLTYLLRVGSGVIRGEYVNKAAPYQSGNRIGNVAAAPILVEEDPIFDKTTLIGKVFHDADGDGWQDPAVATGVTIKGGFTEGAYLINSTLIDRGEGPWLMVDRGFVSPIVDGWDLGELPGRSSRLDDRSESRVILEVTLTTPVFKDLTIRTDEGTRIRIDREGNLTEHHVGAKARGENAQDIRVLRRVETERDLIKMTLVITNEGLEEHGIPGVRVATAEGLIMETDAGGRFHLADVDGGGWERGRNVILKTDPATLPPGASFTTENPRVHRVTPSLMGKVNFGVQLPPQITPRRNGPGGRDSRSEDYARSGGEGIDSPTIYSFPDESSTDRGPGELDLRTLNPVDSPLLANQDTTGGDATPPWLRQLPGTGAVWTTVDPSGVDPAMNVGASSVLPLVRGELRNPVRFSLWSNYNAFIDRWEILIYRGDDEDLVRPVRTLVGTDVAFETKVAWNGVLDGGGSAEPGDVFFYVLRAYDKDEHVDETVPKTIRFVEDPKTDDRSRILSDDEEARKLPVEGGEIYGTNGLALQTIPVRGGRVRVHGTGVTPGVRITVDGRTAPQSSVGSFAVEEMLPVGTHEITIEATDGKGEVWRRVLTAHVPESHFFMVGLADLTVGKNDISGNVEPLSPDDRFDDDVFADGRLAFYLKGKIKGRYLVAAQLDTEEEALGDLFDNIHKKDARSLLRRLDPDRYYPVYGDQSTTQHDAQSQGRMFARVEWDRSQLVWGNYHTGLTGTEFAQYNRSLYGAKLQHQSLKTNAYGEHQGQVTAFASEQQTAMGHDELLGTGGSLYYLSHTDIVQGSEKVWVEIRDRDSRRVIENVTLERYRDYEIDEIQGRIILNRPLTQVAEQVAPSIIKDTPLDGNDVVLLADYEFVPTGFTAGEMSYGARAKGQPGNNVALGGTYAHENRNDMDYNLWGVDGALRAGKGTYLKGEYAESESRQTAAGRFSADGGLTYVDIPSAANDTSGAAVGVEARIDLDDLTDGSARASAGGWWKRRDAGFSTARTDGIGERTEYGGEFLWKAGDGFRLSGRGSTTELEHRPQGPDSTTIRRRYSLQTDIDATDRIKVSAEARRIEDLLARGDEAKGTLAGLRLGYDVTRNVNLYGIGQATVDREGSYEENNLGTLGIDFAVRDYLTIRGEGTSGNRGDAVVLGADLAMSDWFRVNLENTSGSLGPKSRVGANWRLSDDHELYGTYTLSPDRTEGKRSVFTVGQRKSLSNQLRVFTESQFTESEQRAGLTHVFGLDFKPSQLWTAGASVQSSNLKDTSAGSIKRNAFSLWAGFDRDGARVHSKIEYRRDSGLATKTQWLTTNRADYRVNRDLELIGKFSLSVTEDADNPLGDAQFVETSVGAAYRPVAVDRWQLLGKYTFLYDMPSSAQMPLRNDERMHVFSTETLYDITHKIGVGGKVAGRWGEVRVDRSLGRWFDSRTYLFVARGQYHIVMNWDALLEYRWLQVVDADDTRHGALVAVYRNLSKHLKAGLGFNFTTFTDDLTDLDYDNRGVFVNVIGKY
jgi:uncharacterized repeat protein (TIGR01451 family)